MDPAALGRVSVWFGDSWCTPEITWYECKDLRSRAGRNHVHACAVILYALQLLVQNSSCAEWNV